MEGHCHLALPLGTRDGLNARSESIDPIRIGSARYESIQVERQRLQKVNRYLLHCYILSLQQQYPEAGRGQQPVTHFNLLTETLQQVAQPPPASATTHHPPNPIVSRKAVFLILHW